MESSSEFITPSPKKRRKLNSESSDAYEPESDIGSSDIKNHQLSSKVKQRRYKFNDEELEFIEQLGEESFKKKYIKEIAEMGSQHDDAKGPPSKKDLTRIHAMLRRGGKEVKRKAKKRGAKQTYKDE